MDGAKRDGAVVVTPEVVTMAEPNVCALNAHVGTKKTKEEALEMHWKKFQMK